MDPDHSGRNDRGSLWSGCTLLNAYTVFRYDVVIAAMLSFAILGFLSDRLVVLVEGWVMRWREGYDVASKTVLFVTHTVDEAIYLANRVLIIAERRSRILKDTAIDLPHPRDRTSEEFNRIKRDVLQIVGGVG